MCFLLFLRFRLLGSAEGEIAFRTAGLLILRRSIKRMRGGVQKTGELFGIAQSAFDQPRPGNHARYGLV